VAEYTINYNVLWSVLAVLLSLVAISIYRGVVRKKTDQGSPVGTRPDATVPSQLSVSGQVRSYYLHPAPAWARAPYPLVLAFHGGQGNGRRFALQTGFSRLARKEGFVVAYPDALGQWNDGRTTTAHGPDDVAFFDALLDHLIRTQNVDPKKVYITGASSGGMFAMRLACERAGRIAASAPVIAALPKGYICPAGPGVPLLIINGTDDAFIPWEGGRVHSAGGRGAGGAVQSVPDTVRFWQHRNRCGPAAKPERLMVRSGEDQAPAEIFRFQGCKEHADLVFVKIPGGGHSWPGGAIPPDMALPNGPKPFVAREPWATALIWSFFGKTRAKSSRVATKK
jgi:polyhydroxybutyrate depolymerase